MHKRTLFASLTISVLAASNIAFAQAQQSTGDRAAVLSASPIHSQSMYSLEQAAQRLRESIQALAQQPAGPQRDAAIRDAQRALYDTQQAMVQLPPEYRVEGMVMSNAPIRHPNPAQNNTFGDSMRELQLAAERLRNAIQQMAQQPVEERRHAAIKQAHEALFETRRAMAVMPAFATTGSASAGSWDRRGSSTHSRAQGSVASRAGAGSVAGGISAGSDASGVQASLPAVAGGVGLNARALLSSEARPDHNVKMVFSLNTGNYLADVNVKVTDQSGRTVIDGVSDGPWLYAKLPPGNYTATATYNGQTVTKQFSAGRSGQRVAHFRWPASVEGVHVSGISPILGTGPQGQ